MILSDIKSASYFKHIVNLVALKRAFLANFPICFQLFNTEKFLLNAYHSVKLRNLNTIRQEIKRDETGMKLTGK